MIRLAWFRQLVALLSRFVPSRHAWRQLAELPAAAYRPCVPLLAALATGIIAGRHLLDSLPRASGLAIVCLILWGWCLRRRLERVASVVLYVALVLASAAWSYERWQLFATDELARSLAEVGQPVSVEAVVRRAPRYRTAPARQPLASIPLGSSSHLEVSVTQVRNGQTWQSASGLATLVVDGHLLGVQAGDRVRIHGWGSRPGPPLNPGEQDFAAHRRGQRQLCRLHAAHPDAVTLVATGWSYHPRRLMDELRRRGQAWLQRHLPAEQTGLAMAILLGAREALDEARSEAFFQSGLAHLLAVSGLNVAIFAYGLLFIARLGFVPRRPAIVLVAGLALLYALLADAEPPVLRAALLVVGSAIGRWSGRRAAGENTLAFAACLVLLFDPSSLFHAGAQLSFLAVVVLDQRAGMLPPPESIDPFDRLLERSHAWPMRWLRRIGRWTWDAFVTSAMVWFVTLPLVWYRFHVISPIALVLNPLVMFPMTIAMYCGAGALAVAGVWPTLSDGLGAICGGCLELIETFIRWGLRLPNNHFWVPAPSWPWLACFYIVPGVWLVLPWTAPPRRWRVTLLVVWLALGIGSATHWRSWEGMMTTRHPDAPCVTFIAVGHGTAVLVELPNGRTLLYDGGRLGNPTPAARAIAGVLWSKGLTHVDAVVISHADADHYNALPELSEQFSFGVVYVSDVMFRDSSPALEALRTALDRAGVAVRQLRAGDRLMAGDSTKLAIWHPPAKPMAGSDNSHSIVLAIEHHGRRLLLPGDLESPGLDLLLSGPPRPCDVVMAPHHGSVKSNPRGFAAWTTPSDVIVSGSASRDDPRLRRAYAEAGSRVLHTGRDGAVEVRFDANGIRVRSWRRDGF